MNTLNSIGNRPSPWTRERFEQWFEPEPNTGCWFWTGAVIPYGILSKDGRNYFAHRMAYKLWNGPIPSGYCVCHHCDQPSCVNPAHLFVGTYAENSQDAVRKGRMATGDRNPARQKSKLTKEIARFIALRRAQGETGAALSLEYGISSQAVCDIFKGRTWRGEI